MECFSRLIESKKVAKDQYANIVAISGGRFSVSAFDTPMFFRYFSEAISSGAQIDLCELPPKQSVLRLDLDIECIEEQLIESEEKELLTLGQNLVYSEEDLTGFVKIANSSLIELLHSVDLDRVACFVLEKPARITTVDDEHGKRTVNVKRGFHVHYPHLIVSSIDQRSWAKVLAERVKDAGLFKFLPKSPIDLMSSVVPWMMYGCKKPPVRKQDELITFDEYLITRAFDALGTEIDYKTLLDSIVIINEIDERPVENATIFQKMSIKPYGRPVSRFLPFCNQSVVPAHCHKWDNDESPTCDIEQIRELVDMLSSKRAENYALWISLGRCLASLTRGSLDGLEIFDSFSKQCLFKYSAEGCESKWSTFSKTDLGIGLLRSWAKNDNLQMYLEWSNIQRKKQIADMERNTSGQLAKLAGKHIENRFVFSAGQWFEYRHPIWVSLDTKQEGTIPLQQVLNGCVKDQLEDFLKGLRPQPGTEKAQKFIMDAIRKLDEPGSLAAIINMLKLDLASRDFAEELNSNPFLVGVKNGIIDLKTATFREGQPDDKISKTFDCDYVEYGENSEEMQNMRQYFVKMFPQDDLREYMMNTMSQVFVGNMFFKNMFFWIGNGDNGKTGFSKSFEDMLGQDYCVKLPTTVLTGDKVGAGRAAPELVALKDKLLAFFDEPESSEKMNSGIVKWLTGHDSLYARDLFQTSHQVVKFIARCLMVFVANDEPDVKHGADLAFWTRIIVIPFMSKFVDKEHVPDTWEEQVRQKTFLKDINFVNDTAKNKPALLYFLLQHFKKIKNEIHLLKTPSCVRKACEDYRAKNDMIKIFMSEEMEVDQDHVVTLRDFKERFDKFSNTKHFGAKMISEYKLIEELKKLSVDVCEDGILGYRLRD